MAVVGSAGGDEGLGSLGLVDLIFWRCWARCPKIVSSASGQYIAMLKYVRPLKVSQFLALMASNHVCLTRKPRQALVEAHEGTDAGEVEGLRVVGGAGCLGCHDHGVGCLI